MILNAFDLFSINERNYPREIIGGIEIETCVSPEEVDIYKSVEIPKMIRIERNRLGDEEHQKYWEFYGFEFEYDDTNIGRRYKDTRTHTYWEVINEDEGDDFDEGIDTLILQQYLIKDGHVKYIIRDNARNITLSDKPLSFEDGLSTRRVYYDINLTDEFEELEPNPWNTFGSWCGNDDGDRLNISPYEATQDGSIRCPGNMTSVEYVTPDPFPIVDIMNKNTQIGTATDAIMKLSSGCIENRDGNISCGTHVHMSYQGISKEDYPGFNVLMRYLWIAFYQPYCIIVFYKWQKRYKNKFAELSSAYPKGKYEMFNEDPSIDSWFWHFEFRGYGEMRSQWENGRAKKYLKILMNMWLVAIDYYTHYKLQDVEDIQIKVVREPENLKRRDNPKLQEISHKKLKQRLKNLKYKYYSLEWKNDAVNVDKQPQVPSLKF